MRSRLALLIGLVVVLATAAAPLAQAAPLHLAQDDSDVEGGDQSDPGTDTEQGEGGGGGEDADAETGAGEGEQGAAEGEEGPQWTYQMSKITLGMTLLLFLAMGALYYRMIARRQRGV